MSTEKCIFCKKHDGNMSKVIIGFTKLQFPDWPPICYPNYGSWPICFDENCHQKSVVIGNNAHKLMMRHYYNTQDRYLG